MSEIVERDSADVHEGAPRFVSLSLEVQAEGEVGFLVKGKGGNLSNKSDVLMDTPRLVLRSFGCLLVLEESKIEGYGVDSGDQMEVLSVVA